MKTALSTNTLRKVRVLLNQDIYYNYAHWDSREIDGVEFLPVVKYYPDQSRTQTLMYLRKDSLEFIK
jgi:hypothetical protein